MFNIRPVKKEDNPFIKKIVQSVLAEHGAVGDGFAGNDPELDIIFEFYNNPGRAYYVLEKEGQIVGGAGISQLVGANDDVCELQKMYFLDKARGHGYGKKMILLCLQKAKELGYKSCYLETLTNMESAQALYKKIGFKLITNRMGSTGHFSCNTFFKMNLTEMDF